MVNKPTKWNGLPARPQSPPAKRVKVEAKSSSLISLSPNYTVKTRESQTQDTNSSALSAAMSSLDTAKRSVDDSFNTLNHQWNYMQQQLIQKEGEVHLAGAKSARLERETTELNAKCELLKTENKDLNTKVGDLQAQVVKLQDQLAAEYMKQSDAINAHQTLEKLRSQCLGIMDILGPNIKPEPGM